MLLYADLIGHLQCPDVLGIQQSLGVWDGGGRGVCWYPPSELNILAVCVVSHVRVLLSLCTQV